MTAPDPYEPSRASLKPIAGAELGFDPALSMLSGAPGFLTLAILGIVKSRILYPKRIDERYARLKGADDSFLASLPNFLPY